MAAPPPSAATIPEPLPEPLRLPRGSVRGLLALGLMATLGYVLLQAPTSTPPEVLVNAVVVALAFYFGSHGPSAAPVQAPSAGKGLRRPWLVRGLLVLGFGGLAGWFYWKGGDVPQVLKEVLLVLGGYVGGALLSWVFHRRAHETPARRRIALIFRDLSAAAALGLTAFACYSFVTGIAGTFSTDVEQALSLVITYYFGSRVIPH